MARPKTTRNGKMEVDYLLNPLQQSHQALTPRHRVYQCNECALTYSLQGNLNKHIKSKHENRRPHNCTFCEAAFPFSDGLRRHVQLVHSGKRPYACPHCQASFKQRSHLAKHINSVHQKR